MDYCSANINAEVFSNESQCVGAAFVGQTPGGRGVSVCGGGRLKHWRRGDPGEKPPWSFSQGPWFPMTPPWGGGKLAS